MPDLAGSTHCACDFGSTTRRLCGSLYGCVAFSAAHDKAVDARGCAGVGRQRVGRTSARGCAEASCVERDGREAGVPVDVSEAALPDGLDTLDASDCASAGKDEIMDGGTSDGNVATASAPLLLCLPKDLPLRPRRALLHGKQAYSMATQIYDVQSCHQSRPGSECMMMSSTRSSPPSSSSSPMQSQMAPGSTWHR